MYYYSNIVYIASKYEITDYNILCIIVCSYFIKNVYFKNVAKLNFTCIYENSFKKNYNNTNV